MKNNGFWKSKTLETLRFNFQTLSFKFLKHSRPFTVFNLRVIIFDYFTAIYYPFDN